MKDFNHTGNTSIFSCIILTFLIFSFLKIEAQTSDLSVADSLYAVGEYAEAIDKLEKIHDKSETVQLKLARYHASRGKPEESIKYYKLVLENNPDRLLTVLDYGKALVKSGKLKTADSLFSNLNKKYPNNAQFTYQQGLIKEKLKDSTAINYFRMAVLLDEHHQNALYKIATQNLKEGQFTMAEKWSLQGLEANPENVSLLSTLAQTYSAIKLYDKAVPRYEKLVELGQGSEFVFSKLGYGQYQTGNYTNAIESYQEALAIEDKNSNTHLMLGKLYANTGDLDKSETHLLMSVLIKKQPVDVEYLNLALTYKLQENYKQAFDYLNKSLEENPENERALYERAIAADNYFKDLETRVNYYRAYLNKYDPRGNRYLINLAKNRIHDLKTEIHMSKEEDD